MQDIDLATYMAEQRRKALRFVEASISKTRTAGFTIGLLLLAAVCMVWSVAGPNSGGIASLLALVGTGWALWAFGVATERLKRSILLLRTEIRNNLTRGGLLRMAAELDGEDRLPHLFSLTSGPLRFVSAEERKTLRGRMLALAAHYAACCEDAGLPLTALQRHVSEDARAAPDSGLVLSLVVIELADALGTRPKDRKPRAAASGNRAKISRPQRRRKGRK